MQSRQAILGLLAFAVLCVAAVPFLLPAGDPQLVQRRASIAALPQAGRERLQRNFDLFKAMDPARKHQVRAFAQALQADETRHRGRLNETLRIYEQWLQTLSPHQRDALRKESDPLQRIELVRRIVDEQRDDRIEIRMGGRGGLPGPVPSISRSDLEAMLEVFTGRLERHLRDRRQLDGYEGMRRSLKMFELLADRGHTARELLSEADMQRLYAAIPDESTRRQLQTLPDGDQPSGRAARQRARLALILFRAIETELDRELQNRRVSPENLAAYFESLPENEQNDLLRRTPAQFHRELLSRYVETEWSRNRINMQLVRQFFRPPRPPGERGPGNGRNRPTGPRGPAGGPPRDDNPDQRPPAQPPPLRPRPPR